MNIIQWFHKVTRGAWGAAPGAALMLAFAGAALAPSMPQAQEPAGETARLKTEVARLKRDIQRAEVDIRRTDSISREEQSTANRNRERLTRDRERREKENDALQARVRDARARIAAERARGDGYVNAAAEEQARGKAVLAFLAVVADSLAARVDAGIPWDNETRRERIISLRRDIDAGNAGPDEAFARLGALLREETKSGDEVTLSSRPLTRRNGEVINAQVLKIGNQSILYVDEEGKKFGILDRTTAANDSSAWTWREDLNLGERTAVKRAVAVKAGRETPQLAALNIPLTGLVVRTPSGTSSANTSAETAEPKAEDKPAAGKPNDAAPATKGGVQ